MEKISVLLPTRNRVPLVEKTIDSLVSTCSDPSLLEILIAVDANDPSISDLKDYVSKQDLNIIVEVFETRHGYQGLHHYVNRLCDIATGHWLFLWNDDSYIETKDWDLMLEPFENEDVVLVSPRVLENPHYPGTMFPFTTKKWFDILGHYSLNCHNDTWVEYVAKDLGVFHFIDMWVNHDMGKILDETYAEREYDREFYSIENDKLRKKDAETLTNYINSKK